MLRIPSICLLLLLSLCSYALSETPPGKNAVRLSNVQTLTLRSDRQTTHRRVPALPQLKCIGPSQICKLYQIDTMRCTNQGYDYDEEDIQWSCTADLPSEFKLGATDVICEGYRNADDKWILKGSCGVEYRLLLTEKGRERHGSWRQSTFSQKDGNESDRSQAGGIVFLILFIGILFIIAIAIAWGNDTNGRRPRGRGGGGGGGGDDNNDPPPPYDWQPSYQKEKPRSGPGFWTGAAAGSAVGGVAGYALGRSQNRRQYDRQYQPGPSFSHYDDDYDSGSYPGPSRSFSPGRQNTGFGSTRRR